MILKKDNIGFFFHDSIVPMLIYEPTSLKIIDANDAAVNLYGYRRSIFQEMLITDLHPQREIPKLLQFIKSQASVEKRKGYWSHLKNDGSLMDVEIFSNSVMLEEVGPIRLVQIRDITNYVKEIDVNVLTNDFLKIYFNNFTIPVMLADLSETMKIFNKNTENGSIYLKPYIEENPSLLNKLLNSIKIIYINEAVLNLYGGITEDFFRQEVATNLNIKSIDDRMRFLENILGTKIFEYEAQSETVKKIPIYLKFNWSVIQGHENKYDKVLISITDMTRVKEMQIEISKLENRIKALFDRTIISDFENTDLGMALIDNNLEFIETNKSFMKLLGYNNEELKTMIFSDLVDPLSQIEIEANIKKMFSGAVESLDIEEELIRSNKETIWCRITISLVQGGYEEKVYGIALVRDITLKKKSDAERNNMFKKINEMHSRLQYLSKGLLEIQEREKRQIAREIHDEIGQVLTAIKIEIQSGLKLIKAGRARKNLMEGIKLVEYAINNVRNLSFQIRPSILDDIGLVSAIRWFVLRQTEKSKIKANINADTFSKHFESDIEITCYRVVQEALTNIIRHAQAKNVTITVKEEKDRLLLKIEDDGTGFDLEKVMRNAKEGKSLGIIIMIERIELIGGKINIDTSETQNRTEITAEFPLA